MIKIPEKQFIVNLDEQCRLLEEDGTAYTDGDVTPSAGEFVLENFLPPIAGSELVELASAVRIRSEAASAAVAETLAYTVTAASGATKGDVFRLVYDSLDKTPTVFQNQPLERWYQLGVDCADAGAVIAELVARINADDSAPVTAYAGFNNATPAQDDSDKIVLVAKSGKEGVEFDLYSPVTPVDAAKEVTLSRVADGTTVYHTSEDTSVTTAAATLPKNNYDALKDIDWAKNLDFDRNVERFPEYGADYQSYYFQFNWTAKDIGGIVTPSVVPQSGRNAVRLWVNTAGASTLKTAMDLLVGDVNV